MLIPQTKIRINQRNTLEEISVLNEHNLPFNAAAYEIEFVNEWSYESNWNDLTNTGTLTIPRNIYITNLATDSQEPLYKKNKNIVTINNIEMLEFGGYKYAISPEEAKQNLIEAEELTKYDDNIPSVVAPADINRERPFIRRGDEIVIAHFYEFYQTNEEYDENGNLVTTQVLKQTPTQLIHGNVTSVNNEIDISITFSDSMYLLKQFGMDNKTYIPDKNDKNPIKTLLTNVLNDINKQYHFGLSTQRMAGGYFGANYIPLLKLEMLGTVITYDNYNLYLSYETVAQLLERLKKEFHLQIYFKDEILYVGYLITYLQDKEYTKDGRFYHDMYKPVFNFQDNIISHNLTFKYKKDMLLTCVSEGQEIVDSTTNFTKKGKAKKVKKKLIVYTTYNSSGEINSWGVDKDKTKDTTPGGNLLEIPVQTSGEKYTFFFTQAKTIKELIALSEEQLKKFHYDGFTGSFTTFGSPFVDYDTIIELRNAMQPEQNGFYRVKSVKYSGGVNGYRQEIELYYKFKIDDVKKIEGPLPK